MHFRHKAHESESKVLLDRTPEPNRHHGESSAHAPESPEISGHQITQPDSFTFSSYETSMKHARSAGGVENRDVVCGPLLNYRYIDNDRIGSVLIVTRRDDDNPRPGPILLIRQSISENSDRSSGSYSDHYEQVEGVLLHSEKSSMFWRFNISLTMGPVARGNIKLRMRISCAQK
jgi:hypothetical protein